MLRSIVVKVQGQLMKEKIGRTFSIEVVIFLPVIPERLQLIVDPLRLFLDVKHILDSLYFLLMDFCAPVTRKRLLGRGETALLTFCGKRE